MLVLVLVLRATLVLPSTTFLMVVAGLATLVRKERISIYSLLALTSHVFHFPLSLFLSLQYVPVFSSCALVYLLFCYIC